MHAPGMQTSWLSAAGKGSHWSGQPVPAPGCKFWLLTALFRHKAWRPHLVQVLHGAVKGVHELVLEELCGPKAHTQQTG